jgi:hypothetical protein
MVTPLFLKDCLHTWPQLVGWATAHPVFGVWCLVFGVWCLVFDVWCLVLLLLLSTHSPSQHPIEEISSGRHRDKTKWLC